MNHPYQNIMKYNILPRLISTITLLIISLHPGYAQPAKTHAELEALNTYHEIFNTGKFVFLNGHFRVGWDKPDNKGSFEGYMSNLMKRGPDGKLLMYRQLAHN